MGGVSMSLKIRNLTYRVEFWVDSRAVGIILIACTIFSLTLSFLPATRSVFNSFWQQPFVVGGGIFAGLVSGKLLDAWFYRLIPGPAASITFCK